MYSAHPIGDPRDHRFLSPRAPPSPTRLFLSPGNQRRNVANCKFSQIKPSHLCYLKPLSPQQSVEAGRRRKSRPV